MLMPEAPVNEDDEIVPRKDQVWPAGQVTPMQPEAEAQRVQSLPDGTFRPCVRGSYACHQHASFRIDF
jgi:hypothetical protein